MLACTLWMLILSPVEYMSSSVESSSFQVLAYKNNIAQCKQDLDKIPGLEYSVEEQDELYEKAVKELQKKKYKIIFIG